MICKIEYSILIILIIIRKFTKNSWYLKICMKKKIPIINKTLHNQLQQVFFDFNKQKNLQLLKNFKINKLLQKNIIAKKKLFRLKIW